MIDDKVYDRFLNTIRDGEADVGTIDIRIDGRWQTIDFRPALARLVAERDDAIAQMNDADSATDNATQIAERVVRELRQEYVDVINRLEKQSAAREATLRAENTQLRQEYENLIGAAANRDVAMRQTIKGIARSLAATANGWPYEHEPVLHVSQAVKLAVDTIDDLHAEVAALRAKLEAAENERLRLLAKLEEAQWGGV